MTEEEIEKEMDELMEGYFPKPTPDKETFDEASFQDDCYTGPTLYRDKYYKTAIFPRIDYDKYIPYEGGKTDFYKILENSFERQRAICEYNTTYNEHPLTVKYCPYRNWLKLYPDQTIVNQLRYDHGETTFYKHILSKTYGKHTAEHLLAYDNRAMHLFFKEYLLKIQMSGISGIGAEIREKDYKNIKRLRILKESFNPLKEEYNVKGSIIHYYGQRDTYKRGQDHWPVDRYLTEETYMILCGYEINTLQASIRSFIEEVEAHTKSIFRITVGYIDDERGHGVLSLIGMISFLYEKIELCSSQLARIIKKTYDSHNEIYNFTWSEGYNNKDESDQGLKKALEDVTISVGQHKKALAYSYWTDSSADNVPAFFDATRLPNILTGCRYILQGPKHRIEELKNKERKND